MNQNVIETTFTNVFPMTNITVDDENNWNADNGVLKNKFDDAHCTIVHWRKWLFLLSSECMGKSLIEEMTRHINSGHSNENKTLLQLKL